MLGISPKITQIVRGFVLRSCDFLLSLDACSQLVRSSVSFAPLITSLVANNMRLLAPLVRFIFFVPFESGLGKELTASTTFTTLSLIAMLNAPVGTLLRTIPSLKAGLACFDRIQTFLKSESR